MRPELPFEDSPLLGGLSPSQFMRQHWQRRSLLVRGALPGFKNLLNRAELMQLAAREDVQSRLVIREGAHYALEHGPFTRAQLRALPASGWTLLVQGLNLHLPAADQLLARFRFIPEARLDDVMVSLAMPGTGVGPHVDSYDVFLVQGEGRRRWRTSTQRDLTLKPHTALRILKRFTPDSNQVLEAGDMLYLPPRVAHDGVALEPSMTYSIGFRAPQAAELAREFLAYLDERLDIQGRFSDPRRPATAHPGQLPEDMLSWTSGIIGRIRWDPHDIEGFLGEYLSRPPRGLDFEPPERPLGRRTFERRLASEGVRLDRRSRLIYTVGAVFFNGSRIACRRPLRPALHTLADQRMLEAGAGAGGAQLSALAELLYPHYRAGELHIGT
jgi:50S ribosomal protein L16 3-hydroxylase